MRFETAILSLPCPVQSCVKYSWHTLGLISPYFVAGFPVLPEFETELFFHYLLPPIILEAAYSLHHRAFLGTPGLRNTFVYMLDARYLVTRGQKLIM